VTGGGDAGRAIDLVLGVLAAETLALLLYRRTRRRGPPYAGIVANALAGGCLLLAVRAALVGLPVTMIGLWLAAALVAHLADLRSRWRVS
jgi:hypothetical protein